MIKDQTIRQRHQLETKMNHMEVRQNQVKPNQIHFKAERQFFCNNGQLNQDNKKKNNKDWNTLFFLLW